MNQAPAVSREAIARLARFILVGGGATLLYFLVALASRAAGAGLMTAHVVAFVISIGASYLGHKLVTFRLKGQVARTGLRFIAATALIAGTQALLVHQLGAMKLDATLIFLVSSAYYPVASFIVHSLWTFRRKH